MNHPMLWHSLRVLAALHLLCIGTAALDLTIGGFLAKDSASVGALLLAILFSSALWIFFATSLQAIALPGVRQVARPTPPVSAEAGHANLWQREPTPWGHTQE
ncbi:MAG: hypothetical protein VX475_19185, partial [Myxococcota bacterium]|nr:hypothetical protein [Myxococcota bacterium]